LGGGIFLPLVFTGFFKPFAALTICSIYRDSNFYYTYYKKEKSVVILKKNMQALSRALLK